MDPECTIAGCDWDEMYFMCSGTGNACSTFPEADCMNVGCNWMPSTCDGTETACSPDMDNNKSGCQNQAGCEWSQTSLLFKSYIDFNISTIPDNARIEEVNFSFVVNQTTNNSHVLIVALNPNASDFTKEGRTLANFWESINLSNHWYRNISTDFVDGNTPCEGTARSCNSMHGEQNLCTNQSGCMWTGSCSGTATDCTAEPDQPSCENQTTCTWDPASCTGTPFTCDTYFDEPTCTGAGCDWDPLYFTCSGTPDACSVQSSDPPCSDYGCTWNAEMCSGVADACDTKTLNYTCVHQDGCTWTGCDDMPVSGPCNEMLSRPDCKQQSGCSWDRLIYNLTHIAKDNFSNSLSSDWWRFAMFTTVQQEGMTEADREATIISNNSEDVSLRPQLIVRYTPNSCDWDGNSTWFVNWSSNCIINKSIDLQNNTLEMVGDSGSFTINSNASILALKLIGLRNVIGTMFAMLTNSTLGLVI
jgi:hypothetical protein